MRIGFDAKRAFYNSSGLGNYSRSILLLLKRYFPENEWVLYTPSTKNSIDFCAEKNFEVKCPETALSRFFSAWWRSSGMTKNIQKDRIDIFHGLSNELPLKIQRSGAKSIVTIHDLIFLRFPEFYPLTDRHIYLRKFRHACNVADCIIAISEQTKCDIIDFLQINPDKIKVSYQGCSTRFWQTVTEEDKQRIKEKYNLPSAFILNVGTMEPRKNLKNLIHALAYTKNDTKLLAIGRPVKSYMKELQEIIIKKKLAERVIFLHDVPNQDLPVIYHLADLFAYPSYFEGFGIPVLEALVSGLPVITSTTSCFPETAGDAAIYINPEIPEEIGAATDRILENQTLKKEMIQKGYKQAQNFSDEAVANSLMTIYRALNI